MGSGFNFCEFLANMRDAACGISSRVQGDSGPLQDEDDKQYVQQAADDGIAAGNELLKNPDSPYYTSQSVIDTWGSEGLGGDDLTSAANELCDELTALYEERCGSGGVNPGNTSEVAQLIWKCINQFNRILTFAGLT